PPSGGKTSKADSADSASKLEIGFSSLLEARRLRSFNLYWHLRSPDFDTQSSNLVWFIDVAGCGGGSGAAFPSEWRVSLHRRHRPAVDDVFAAVDRGCAIRDEEGDELRDFLRTPGPDDRDAAERAHQPLAPRRFAPA